MSTESHYSKKIILSYLLQIYVNFHIFSKLWFFAKFEEKVDFCSKNVFLALESAWNLDIWAEICSVELLFVISGHKHEVLLCLPPFRHQQSPRSNDCYIQAVVDRHMWSSLQSAWKCQRTVRLLLFSTSPHPLWEHLLLSKGASSVDHQITQLCRHQNNKKVRFPYLERVRNFRVQKFNQNLWL